MTEPLNKEQILKYISKEWPDIADQQGCVDFVLRNFKTGSDAHHLKELDQRCCYWMRHEGDF
jgi:hypothetical protein